MFHALYFKLSCSVHMSRWHAFFSSVVLRFECVIGFFFFLIILCAVYDEIKMINISNILVIKLNNELKRS